MKRARTLQHASPFSITEEGPFLVSLNSAILGAAHVQDLIADMHRLNSHEQIFICVDTFLTDANADGVGHFFYHDCADLFGQVLLGLEEIGARNARIGLERYVELVFGGVVPKSMVARQDALEALDAGEQDEADRVVGDLSRVASLLAAWARGHHEHFRIRPQSA